MNLLVTDDESTDLRNEIAIIGMAGRFPAKVCFSLTAS